MKKQLLTLFCASFYLLSLVGCGGSPKSDFTGISFANDTIDYDGETHTLLASGVPDFATASYTNAGPFTNPGSYEMTCKVTAKDYHDLVLNATLTINKINFSGITFTDSSLTYDGKAHTLEVVGLPAIATVSYSANGPFTDVGVYPMSATIKATGYNDLVLNATLTIINADILGMSFSSDKFEYDGRSHAIYVSGTLPTGASVTYSCSKVEGMENSAVEVGKYPISALITAPNFNNLTLDATLEVYATEENRSIVQIGNNLYFQNAQDNDKLYTYNSTDGVNRLTNDIPYYLTTNGSNKLYYKSGSLFLSSFKSYDTSATSEQTSILGSINASYIIINGSAAYYAVNDITNSKSGIYKLDLSSSDNSPVLLSQGKAKYLQYDNAYLYFADGLNDWKLAKQSISGTERINVVDKAIKNLYLYNSVCYYTVDALLGNYIEKYTISSGVAIKLTCDAGCNLVVVGNTLYYVNTDFLTSAFIGNGIYSVSINIASNNSLPGAKVIDGGENGLSSLAYLGGYLYYYQVNGYKLMKYDLSSQTSTDLLDGFVTPDETPLSLGSHTDIYGDIVYFLNLYEDKTLWSYHTVTGTLSKLTSNKVTDFSVIGDYLYLNQVSKLVDNDLFRVSLKMGGSPELISTNDANDIVSDGTNLYYVEENVAGVDTAIHQCGLDGSNDTVIYDKGAYNLQIYNNVLYFIVNKAASAYGYINKIDLANIAAPVAINDLETSCFVLNNGYFYFRELYGLAWAFKRLSKISIDGNSGYVVLISDSTDPIHIAVDDNYIYYYNYAESALSSAGLYHIGKNATDQISSKLLACNTTYYCSSLLVHDNIIYFINYYLAGALGDSHFYQIKRLDSTLKQIA